MVSKARDSMHVTSAHNTSSTNQKFHRNRVSWKFRPPLQYDKSSTGHRNKDHGNDRSNSGHRKIDMSRNHLELMMCRSFFKIFSEFCLFFFPFEWISFSFFLFSLSKSSFSIIKVRKGGVFRTVINSVRHDVRSKKSSNLFGVIWFLIYFF